MCEKQRDESEIPMQSQEPTGTTSEIQAQNEAVFSTAHLVWLDLESGDELSIELFGPRPFLDELVAQGFLLKECRPTDRPELGRIDTQDGNLEDTQFRIHARVGRN